MTYNVFGGTLNLAQSIDPVEAGRPQGWAMRGLKDGSPPAGAGSSPVGVWGRRPQKLTTFSQNDA